MAIYLTLGCDANDPQRLAAFWALAPGYVKESGFDEPDNASLVDPDGRGPAIGFLTVPEGKSAKNRMHIDVRVAGPGPRDMAERARLMRQKVPALVAAGAAVVRAQQRVDRHYRGASLLLSSDDTRTPGTAALFDEPARKGGTPPWAGDFRPANSAGNGPQERGREDLHVGAARRQHRQSRGPEPQREDAPPF